MAETKACWNLSGREVIYGMHPDIEKMETNLFRGIKKPPRGELGRILEKFDPELLIAHPTFHCQKTIGDLVAGDVAAARKNFPGERVAIIVSDGTYNDQIRDDSNIEAALEGGSRAMKMLSGIEREKVMVYAGPHDGWNSERFSPGKGNGMKMVFEEMAFTGARAVMALDGDLRNDMHPWQRAFKEVIRHHETRHPGGEFFVTARYARHFVDASLTRMIIGPLTTLMGCYVPGAISGDIVLSAKAAARQLTSPWDQNRRNYGTDIATALECIADSSTEIYELYLGAKLHDITDDAKLAVMPEQVIGSALERLLHYEEKESHVTRRLTSDKPLKRSIFWDSDRTGIEFINPGYTDVFNIDRKIDTLIRQFPEFRQSLKWVLSPETYQELEHNHKTMAHAAASGQEKIRLMDISLNRWVRLLFEIMGYLLATRDLENSTRALNFLFMAAFTQFCVEKLSQLGAVTLSQARSFQKKLGVDNHRAKEFYSRDVDEVFHRMAISFFQGRSAILERMYSAASRSGPRRIEPVCQRRSPGA